MTNKEDIKKSMSYTLRSLSLLAQKLENDPDFQRFKAERQKRTQRHKVDIDKLSFELINYYFAVILDDRIWQVFGFKKRPKRGKVFDFLISKKQKEIEEFVITEVFAICFIDIKDALKEMKHFATEIVDFRALALVGIFSHAMKLEVFKSIDKMLEVALQANEYTRPVKELPSRLFDRLHSRVDLTGVQRTMMFMRIQMAFGSVVQNEGVIVNASLLREKLERVEPEGSVNASSMAPQHMDKVIEVSFNLING